MSTFQQQMAEDQLAFLTFQLRLVANGYAVLEKPLFYEGLQTRVDALIHERALSSLLIPAYRRTMLDSIDDLYALYVAAIPQ